MKIKQIASRLRTSLNLGRRKVKSPQTQPSRWPVTFESGFKSAKSALIVHGLHKSATTFLFQFFAEICRQIEVPIFSVHNQPPDHFTIDAAIDHSFVLCPARSFETKQYAFPDLESKRHLFQVRDPRDVLVSEYYSIGWRHSVEGWSQEDLQRRALIRTLSVDEYVLREPEISKYPLLERYEPLLKTLLVDGHQQIGIAKYETMVTDFASWLAPVLHALDIDCVAPVNEQLIPFLLNKYQDDFRPDSGTAGHKRNVTPGDHRNKLSIATIETLNQRFEKVLSALDYQHSPIDW